MAKLIALFLALLSFLLKTTSVSADSIVINEIMANPNSGEKEWVELYNSTSSSINLSGWVIEERTGSELSGKKQHPLPTTTIESNNFYSYEFSTASASLNNSGDIVTLIDNNGNVLDTYQYNSATKGKTFGRQPDGGSWKTNLTSTRNSSNGELIPSPSPTDIPSPSLSPTPTPTPNSTSTPTPKPNNFSTSQPSIKPSATPSISPKISNESTHGLTAGVSSPDRDKTLSNNASLGISTMSATVSAISEIPDNETTTESFFAGDSIKKISIISGVIIILASLGWYLRFKYKNVQS